MDGFWPEIRRTLKEIFIVSWMIAIGIFMIGLGVIFFMPFGIVLVPLGFYTLYRGLKKIWIDFIDRNRRQNPAIQDFVNKLFGLPPRPRV